MIFFIIPLGMIRLVEETWYAGISPFR